MGNNNNLGALLLGLGALYLITRDSKQVKRGGAGSSVYVQSYTHYIPQASWNPDPPEQPENGNIAKSLKGFKTPAQAIKYAPTGAGVVLHSAPKLSGGYAIR
jgi:hypothetical protein